MGAGICTWVFMCSVNTHRINEWVAKALGNKKEKQNKDNLMNTLKTSELYTFNLWHVIYLSISIIDSQQTGKLDCREKCSQICLTTLGDMRDLIFPCWDGWIKTNRIPGNTLILEELSPKCWLAPKGTWPESLWSLGIGMFSDLFLTTSISLLA